MSRPQAGASIITLALLSSLLSIQYITGFSIIDPMSNNLLITTANAEFALFITFGLALILGTFFLGPLTNRCGPLPGAVASLNLYPMSSLTSVTHHLPTWFLVCRMVSGFTFVTIIITSILH